MMLAASLHLIQSSFSGPNLNIMVMLALKLGTMLQSYAQENNHRKQYAAINLWKPEHSYHESWHKPIYSLHSDAQNTPETKVSHSLRSKWSTVFTSAIQQVTLPFLILFCCASISRIYIKFYMESEEYILLVWLDSSRRPNPPATNNRKFSLCRVLLKNNNIIPWSIHMMFSIKGNPNV